MGNATHKWVIDKDGFGPRQELVTLIPRRFSDDDDWYFSLAMKKAFPQSLVFDSPEECALAAIEINEKERCWLQVQNDRLREWHEGLTKLNKKETQQVREAATTVT